MSFRIRITFGKMPEHFEQKLTMDEEAGAAEVAARPDTFSIMVEDSQSRPVGYAIMGADKGGMIAIYYARSFEKMLGAQLIKNIFGASQILGKPMRMHASSLRDIQVKARMFGADFAFDGVDSDGILQGIFANGQ
ncbi:MAG: hypothetical protein AAF429_14480 [Pseudomonadota bacterium]